VYAAAALDSSLSIKAGVTASASPWHPVHSSSASNGAHGGAAAHGGVDDEFDLLSSRSKSPPTISATSAGDHLPS